MNMFGTCVLSALYNVIAGLTAMTLAGWIQEMINENWDGATNGIYFLLAGSFLTMIVLASFTRTHIGGFFHHMFGWSPIKISDQSVWGRGMTYFVIPSIMATIYTLIYKSGIFALVIASIAPLLLAAVANARKESIQNPNDTTAP